MSKIYVISDTHFNHTNILKFTDADGKLFRGDLFKDTDEMNEYMVGKWNETVTPEDHVYHLGDVYFGSKEKADLLLSRLNGKKRLVLGNHDDGKDPVLQKHFQKIMVWRKWPEYDCILSHCPLHSSNLYGKVSINVHGHIHQNQAPSNIHVNMSVEQIDYTPQLLDDVIRNHKKIHNVYIHSDIKKGV